MDWVFQKEKDEKQSSFFIFRNLYGKSDEKLGLNSNKKLTLFKLNIEFVFFFYS